MTGRQKNHGELTDREVFFMSFAKKNGVHLILRDKSGATLSMMPLVGGRGSIHTDQLTVDLQEKVVHFRAYSNSGTTKFLAALEELKVPYGMPAEPPSLEYIEAGRSYGRAYEQELRAPHEDAQLFRKLAQGEIEPEISITLDDAVKHLEAIRGMTGARTHAADAGQHHGGNRKGKPASR